MHTATKDTRLSEYGLINHTGIKVCGCIIVEEMVEGLYWEPLSAADKEERGHDVLF